VKGWARLPWRPVLLVVGLIGAGLMLRGAGLGGVATTGRHGPFAYVVLGTMACAVGVPRQVVAYAGGLAWGFWPGAALGLAAQVLGCAATLSWSRLVARRWATCWLRRRATGRLARLDAFLARNPFTATLTMRLLPVGSNMVLTLIAGVSAVPAGPFLAASALGYVPQTVVFALLGSGVRVEHGLQVALAAVLLALSLLLGAALVRRGRVPSAEGLEPISVGGEARQ
jgi:uncharacterized membrane protein YdjX (TVP38/TMEM64 family)